VQNVPVDLYEVDIMSDNNADKIVIVTGDVAMDWNLAHSRLCASDPSLWRVCDETKAYWQRGGSALLADLVTEIATELHVSGSPPFSIRQTAAPCEPNKAHTCNPEFHHSYVMWSPFASSKGARTDSEKPTWRVEQFLGLDRATSDSAMHWQKVVDDAPDADLVILDDAGLGFRDDTTLWPAAVTTPRTNHPPWVILKMARPLAKGRLWERLHRACPNRLISVASVEDLRLSALQVSRGLSWERTAQDLFWELVHNPFVKTLSHCTHVIISFGTDGALLLSRQDEVEEQKKETGAESHPTFQCSLFFDPQGIEGMWVQQYPGGMMGYTTCLTASIARQVMLNPENPNVVAGVQAGLAAMRRLHKEGYGIRGTNAAEAKLAFPLEKVAEEIAKPTAQFVVTSVRDPVRFIQPQGQKTKQPPVEGFWTILQDRCTGPLNDLATKVVLNGSETTLKEIPRAEFGKLITVDRQEIESFRSIRNLIFEYCKKESQTQPLSIAVFGPPGAGKSFGIKQIANSLLPGQIEVLTFNLSQFDTEGDLHDAFHQVRDAGLSGKISLVFWDEFDTSMSKTPLGWLRYFLSPMQDGGFQDGQIIHPIGRSIFVFAGGTSDTMAAFDHGHDEKFKDVKGPDFISRLKGYINILGPNPVSGSEHPEADPYYVIRRAIIVRSNLERNARQIFTRRDGNKVPRIDEGVLRALLQIGEYKHGARSIESIITTSQLTGKSCFERSDLPPESQLNLHVDGARFLSLVQQPALEGEMLENLAQAAHEIYCEELKAKGYTYGPKTDEEKKIQQYLIPYDELPEDIKEQSRDNVRDIPVKLAAAGYLIVPAHSNEPAFSFSDEEVEQLAEGEHERWMRAKLAQGWSYAKKTDSATKQNEYMIPWEEVSEEAKDKDRALVRHIPQILAQAGYTSIKPGGGTEGDT